MENLKAQIILKKGREKSVLNRHPWIFSGAIKEVKGRLTPGDVVTVLSASRDFLGKGFVNPKSQIFVRLLTFHDEPIDQRYFANRIKKAWSLRNSIVTSETNAYRVVNAEGDFLPGLIIDKYASALVVQFNSLGMHKLKSMIIEVLQEIINPDSIVERTEGEYLKLEGLEASSKPVFGKAPIKVQITENGVKFWVDILSGQKTGFFLDQRQNRRLIAQLSRGKRLLNCFSYTGGFSLYAAIEGAVTTSVEISEAAQQLAQENFRLNDIDPQGHQFVTGNVFDYLRDAKDNFEIIVLDPPAFVKKKQHLQKGTHGYKDINRLAMRRVEVGGYLLSCSCSSYVSWDLFQKILFAAAKESDREIQIVGRFGSPPDHPMSIYHPEGEYLKSFLLRVV